MKKGRELPYIKSRTLLYEAVHKLKWLYLPLTFFLTHSSFISFEQMKLWLNAKIQSIHHLHPSIELAQIHTLIEKKQKVCQSAVFVTKFGVSLMPFGSRRSPSYFRDLCPLFIFSTFFVCPLDRYITTTAADSCCSACCPSKKEMATALLCTVKTKIYRKVAHINKVAKQLLDKLSKE